MSTLYEFGVITMLALKNRIIESALPEKETEPEGMSIDGTSLPKDDLKAPGRQERAIGVSRNIR